MIEHAPEKAEKILDKLLPMLHYILQAAILWRCNCRRWDKSYLLTLQNAWRSLAISPNEWNNITKADFLCIPSRWARIGQTRWIAVRCLSNKQIKCVNFQKRRISSHGQSPVQQKWTIYRTQWLNEKRCPANFRKTWRFCSELTAPPAQSLCHTKGADDDDDKDDNVQLIRL